MTGATSGIGLATRVRLLAQGHQVIGVGRDFSKIDAAPGFEPVELDFSDLGGLPEKLRDLAHRRPRIDALVLSAGRGVLGHLEELSFDQIRRLIDLNFTSQAFVVRALLPGLKRLGRGDVILMGSEAALRGSRQGSIYCASKFALRGFAQALREECARSGVKVTIINPGVVRTPFFDDLPIEPGEHQDNALLPEEVAEMVAMVLSQGAGAVIDEINLSPLKKVVRRKR